MYPWKEHEQFWSSMAELEQTLQAAEVVNALVAQALSEPLATPPQADGVRVIKSPQLVTDDAVTYPALRLAYRVTENVLLPQENALRFTVELLHVRAYDETADAQEELLEGAGGNH
jgi:hypothetical protein